MQATVRSFDPVAGSGSVFLDDGTVVVFGSAAFARSGLRLLRPGQRVAIRCDPSGAITGLTLATFVRPGTAAVDAAGGSTRPGGAADAAGGAG